VFGLTGSRTSQVTKISYANGEAFHWSSRTSANICEPEPPQLGPRPQHPHGADPPAPATAHDEPRFPPRPCKPAMTVRCETPRPTGILPATTMGRALQAPILYKRETALSPVRRRRSPGAPQRRSRSSSRREPTHAPTLHLLAQRARSRLSRVGHLHPSFLILISACRFLCVKKSNQVSLHQGLGLHTHSYRDVSLPHKQNSASTYSLHMRT